MLVLFGVAHVAEAVIKANLSIVRLEECDGYQSTQGVGR